MSKPDSGTLLPGRNLPAYEVRVMSTTEGRQQLPNVLQTIYGKKGITAFGRYGRMIAAAVPYEAVQLLAGIPISPEQEVRIRNAARNLMEALNIGEEEE